MERYWLEVRYISDLDNSIMVATNIPKLARALDRLDVRYPCILSSWSMDRGWNFDYFSVYPKYPKARQGFLQSLKNLESFENIWF